MDSLVLLWMLILGIMLLVYLGFPIFSKTGSQDAVSSEDIIEERRRTLFQERERSYAALAELDEDYETGKTLGSRLPRVTRGTLARNGTRHPAA